ETNVAESLTSAVVSFADLPERVVIEFATFIQGLVANVALLALAAVRSNTYRILTRFSRDLDPAYLGHRMLLPHPEDAEEHLVDAVVNELLAVLESADVRRGADLEVVRSMLTSGALSVNGVGKMPSAATRLGLDLKNLALKLAEYGVESAAVGLQTSE